MWRWLVMMRRGLYPPWWRLLPLGRRPRHWRHGYAVLAPLVAVHCLSLAVTVVAQLRHGRARRRKVLLVRILHIKDIQDSIQLARDLRGRNCRTGQGGIFGDRRGYGGQPWGRWYRHAIREGDIYRRSDRWMNSNSQGRSQTYEYSVAYRILSCFRCSPS